MEVSVASGRETCTHLTVAVYENVPWEAGLP